MKIDELELVKEFHRKFDIPISETISVAFDRTGERFNWLQEEVDEYRKSLWERDMIGVSDALGDILYILYGTVLEHGLQDKFKSIFEEIHRSNMTKSYSKFKIKKGANYSPPDLKSILNVDF